jgi:two-component system, NarL family, sensor histidine kinase DesK
VTVTASLALFSRRLRRVPGAADAAGSAALPVRWLAVGCAAAALAAGVLLAARNYGLWPVGPALMVAAAAAFLGRRGRRRLLASAALAALVPGTVVNLVSGDGETLYAALFPVGMIAFTAWTSLGPLWAWDVAEQLDQARRLAAELAVADERLRFAADLHDIQGHHLQVIALKSELAARLATADPQRATEQMRAVHELATDALRDTRALVQGYRRTTLSDEIANATRVLAAADIDARTELEPGPAGDTDRLSPSSRHLLGLVMREATTNVLRHSRARHAEVGYRVNGGHAHLQVRNDGAAEPPGGPSVAPPGTGLRTLAERLAAAGGELTWKHDGDHFQVSAVLPVDATVPAR